MQKRLFIPTFLCLIFSLSASAQLEFNFFVDVPSLEQESGDSIKIRFEKSDYNVSMDTILVELICWIDQDCDNKLGEDEKTIKHYTLSKNQIRKQYGIENSGFECFIDTTNLIYQVAKYNIDVNSKYFKWQDYIPLPAKEKYECSDIDTEVNVSFLGMVSSFFYDYLPYKLLGRGQDENAFSNHETLCVYDTKANKMKKKISKKGMTFSSPNISGNNKNLVFVSKNGEYQNIAWCNVKKEVINVFEEENVLDKSPFWLNDNETILFVRNGMLCVGNAKKMSVEVIDVKHRIDQILEVEYRQDTLCIYYAEDTQNSLSKEKRVFFLQLDSFYSILEESLLVPSLLWYMKKGIHPKGDRYVLQSETEEKLTKIYLVNENENESDIEMGKLEPLKTSLQNDMLNYAQPQWSGDGKYLVFTSDESH